MPGTTAVIVVAAGSGMRLGLSVPKALVPVAGRPLVGWAVDRASGCAEVTDVVVVAPRMHLEETRRACVEHAPPGVDLQVVAGGAERADSVAAGLAVLPERVAVVLVHDAARGLTPSDQFALVASAVRSGHPAVVPGAPVVDTVKEVDAHGVVVATPPRSRLRAIQTPQGFTREVLTRAHLAHAKDPARTPDAETDDASLVERMGLPVIVVSGHPLAHKITTAQDLHLVEALLAAEGVPEPTVPAGPIPEPHHAG